MFITIYVYSWVKGKLTDVVRSNMQLPSLIEDKTCQGQAKTESGNRIHLEEKDTVFDVSIMKYILIY